MGPNGTIGRLMKLGGRLEFQAACPPVAYLLLKPVLFVAEAHNHRSEVC